MNTHDSFTKQIEEFNTRLASMANHQRQAFTLLFADRLRRDWDVANKPFVDSYRLKDRARQWFVQHIATPFKQFTAISKTPKNASAQVVEAEYRFVDPAMHKNDKPNQGKGEEHGTSHDMAG